MNSDQKANFPLNNDQKADLLLAEYKALRDEILKRMEMRHQFVFWGLMATGAFFTYAAARGVPASVPLLLPVYGFSLAWGWMHNDVRIAELGEYVQTEIESRVGDVKMWQAWKERRRGEQPETRFLGGLQLAAAGVFVSFQLLAMAVAYPRLGTTFEWSFFVMDAVLIGLTVFLVMRRGLTHWWKRYSERARTRAIQNVARRSASNDASGLSV